MIESIIIYYLNNMAELSAPAYAEIQKESPKEFFIVENTGTSLKDHIETTTLAVRSYAQSMERAAVMAYEIDAVLQNIIELDEIAGVKRNSISNFTDPNTKQYRYQGVYVITHY